MNYPWDRWSVQHADNGWFYMISRAWADTVHIYSGQGYMNYLDNGVTNGYDWYVVYGGQAGLCNIFTLVDVRSL